MADIGKPDIDAKLVDQVLRKFGFKLPENVNVPIVRRWHLGEYYEHGEPGLWIPISGSGGIATKAFWSHTVKFPAKIDRALRKILVAEMNR